MLVAFNKLLDSSNICILLSGDSSATLFLGFPLASVPSHLYTAKILSYAIVEPLPILFTPLESLPTISVSVATIHISQVRLLV